MVVRIKHAEVLCYLDDDNKVAFEIPMNMSGDEFHAWKSMYKKEAIAKAMEEKTRLELEIAGYDTNEDQD